MRHKKIHKSKVKNLRHLLEPPADFDEVPAHTDHLPYYVTRGCILPKFVSTDLRKSNPCSLMPRNANQPMIPNFQSWTKD